MIWCGLFCSTFWADIKTLRIIRESQTSDVPTKEASKSCLVASAAVKSYWSRTLIPVMLRWNEPDSFIPAFSCREQLQVGERCRRHRSIISTCFSKCICNLVTLDVDMRRNPLQTLTTEAALFPHP
ncbi:hypothetical protein AVEN_176191-1 [Araneus ventricosus]|uniref:Uncharacterized protein n=1 Tax=Araneus ventricosus TaxID=182803 RepID=A0A4Y2QAC2_ARAVE|nr:hypothetical protein AVEN_206563-1 [Araneus ventricosus]GBN60019.1 hypothetical protein AVEN_176191-1 [Araneus ventricosus]